MDACSRDRMQRSSVRGRNGRNQGQIVLTELDVSITDDRLRYAVHTERSPDCRRITSERAAPQAVRDQNDICAAPRKFFRLA
jgi:hypothetical protein